MDNKFVLSQSFNEIVFEKRNKKYGAYDIRRKYSRYALVAGACAILFFTCGSLTWAYVQAPEAPKKYRVVTIDDSQIKNIQDPAKPKEDQPEPPKEEPINNPAPKGPTTPSLTVVIDIVSDSAEVPPSNLGAGMDSLGKEKGTGSGPVVTGGCTNCPKKDSVPPIVIVDWSMYPPTCDQLDSYITSSIRYPDICREQGIEGTVYVEFIVDTKGSYRDVKVVKGPHPALNKEALRVMSAMPKWTPAKDDKGNLVEYIMRKPIRFQLAH